MNTPDTWEGVDVLIPKQVHQNRREAIEAACFDIGALVGALPGTSPTPLDAALSDLLAHAGPTECKAWITRAIRALPTRADMEVADDDA